MEQRRATTITDVARRARVSAGTVSNVLTGKRPVADETRQRILQAIDELGYQPNLLARSLVNRASKTVGVVASGLEYYGPSRTLVGIEYQANLLGYSLLLDLLHTPETEDVELILNDLTSRRVDGIIWAVHEVGNNRNWLAPERLHTLPPIVFLTMEKRLHAPVISTDNRAGAQLAVEHLIARGCRVIAVITGPLTWWEARERLVGWQICLEQAGLEHGPDLVYEGDWTATCGEQALHHFMEHRPDVDAIFACNDQMALGVLRANHFLGRQIPHELAIVGFDNMPEAAFFCPSLTSVRQHLTDLGHIAVEELHRMIEARNRGETTEPAARLIAPELVVRESTAGRG